jgi:hypothetical protein
VNAARRRVVSSSTFASAVRAANTKIPARKPFVPADAKPTVTPFEQRLPAAGTLDDPWSNVVRS